MSLIHLEDQNFADLIKEGTVLIDFYADWCGPCKMIVPVIESLALERDDINIIKIDVDKQDAIASKFGVLSIPTLHLYKDGKLVSERKGFQTKETLTEWIDGTK